MYSSSHITDQTQITYELHTGAPKTKLEDRRPMIRWKNGQPGAQRVYCGAGQAYILKLSCLFAENTIERAGGLDIRSRHGRLVRTLGFYGLPCSFRGNTGTSRDTSVASGVRPRRGAERPGGRSGTELSGGPAADGHKCAGWTDPDRAPPACELYNSLGGLRNIPLSFSACCVTGNALLRPSERPPAPLAQRARAVPHEHHDNPYRMRLTHTSTRCLSFAGIFRSRPWPASLHPRARLPGPALVP